MKGLRERLREKNPTHLLDDTDPTLLHDYYQSVLDSVGSVIYTVNRDLRITGVNRQWDEFALSTGAAHLTSDHILGTPLLDQIKGAPLARWQTVCQQILDGQLPRYLDEVDSKKAYTWRHFSLSATPLRDSRGEILGITFVAANITQLKKAEYEMFQRMVEIRGLRQVAQIAGAWTERRKVFKQITSDIAHLFSAEKCVIFLWDESSGNLQAQEPAYGLAGRKLSNLSLDMGHPADPDSLWPDLEEKDFIMLNEGDDAPADVAETSARVDRLAAMMAVLRASGRIHGTILVAGRSQPFTEQEGQLLSVFAVPIVLATENAELNQQLLDRTQQLAVTRNELEQMVKVKEAIRMPLTVVRGYLELLLDGMLGSVPQAQRVTMQMVLDKTHAIVSLVNRISPPRFPSDATRYEQIDLVELLQGVVEEQTDAIQRAGLDLSIQVPASGATQSTTLGDPDLLRKVFDALLDNAIKFTAAGGALKVSVSTSNGISHVKVADTGAGIPVDRLVHIWKPRQPAHPFGPIRLSEVKRIVEGHGGQVWAESTPGEGSTFHVALRRN